MPKTSSINKEKGTIRTCRKGHTYNKTSDCPTCPVCEKMKQPAEGLLSALSAPARRALQNQGINTTKDLAGYTKKFILSLHGMGPASLPALERELKKEKLSFRKD